MLVISLGLTCVLDSVTRSFAYLCYQLRMDGRASPDRCYHKVIASHFSLITVTLYAEMSFLYCLSGFGALTLFHD